MELSFLPVAGFTVGLYTNYLASLNTTNSVVNLAVGGYTTYHTLPTGTINPANRPAVDAAHNDPAGLRYGGDRVRHSAGS